ncbi:MAG TPA: alkaline phosphatase D family protein [Gemmatimonadaceae bacterium]
MSDPGPKTTWTRREMLVATAASLGAVLAWPGRVPRASMVRSVERRDLFPEGVASGDPHSDSVLLWTRRPPVDVSDARTLRLEVATDPEFARVISSATGRLSAESDWTCRVLAVGLRPARVYWYRFTDEHGFSSRVGRTITAPVPSDERPVRFAFVSCQNVQQGGQQAYRRMIWEDEHESPDAQLQFVLHLGDFVYEIVWYPEDRPQGMYTRRIRDIVRYASGEKHADFHVPTTVDDYRALYRAYLSDPDLQDARARWPFICMWDNHEFSWKGWQSQENFGQGVVPAQTRKVAAAQAWFEYQPARAGKNGAAGGGTIEHLRPPTVRDRPLDRFDSHGLGLDAGNLAAIRTLTLYRTFRWGRHVELLLTDNRSFRAEPITDRPEAKQFVPKAFPLFLAQDVIETLDAGRAANDGHPPATIPFGGTDVPNPRRTAAPQSMLGAEQKAWFFEQIERSTAQWKLWGNSVATLDWRTDCHNVPPESGAQWPTTGYAQLGDDDWTGYRTERAEILEFLRREKITGVASLAGDRHSFQAGVLSRSLPPHEYVPVAVEFVTGSISAPGVFEAAAYSIPKNHPLRGLYAYDPPDGAGPPQPSINVTLMHGVRSSLALQRTHDPQEALAMRNPDVAPHLAFMDAGGHGYAVVRVTADALEVEFVAIPRPVERIDAPDGGPIAYRVVHHVAAWNVDTPPRLERRRVEGTLPLVL